MTEKDTDQILPPDYTAPVGPEDDRGFIDLEPPGAGRPEEPAEPQEEQTGSER